jgi:hypothetical protein
MFSSARKSGLFENMRGRNNEPEKKELTDAEAKEKVENYFKGQENQIKLMQTRLQIQRKYYAEFAKTLTPQQLAKVFEDQPMRQMNGRRRPGGPAGFGTHP